MSIAPPAAYTTASRGTLPILALLAGADAFGYAMVLPLLPLVAADLGLPTLAVGAVFAAYSLCQVVAAPVIGLLGDRHGVKRVLLVCQAGTIVGFALLFHLRAPWLLFASRAIDGTTAGNVALLYGAALKALPPERQAGGIAALATATSVGVFCGLLSATVVVRWGFDALIALVVGVSLAILGVTARWFPRDAAGVGGAGYVSLRTLPRILTTRTLRLALAAVLAYTTLQASFLTTLPALLARLRSFDAAGVTRALIALFFVAALFQLGILTLLNRRFSAPVVATIAFALAAGGSIVFASGWRWAIPGGAALVMGSCALLGPSLAVVLGRFAASLYQGTVMGLNQAAVSIGQLLGPLLGYALLALGSSVAPRAGLAVIGAVGIGLLALMGRERRDAPAI